MSNYEEERHNFYGKILEIDDVQIVIAGQFHGSLIDREIEIPLTDVRRCYEGDVYLGDVFVLMIEYKDGMTALTLMERFDQEKHLPAGWS